MTHGVDTSDTEGVLGLPTTCPFCGSGRTGLTARRLGLDFVGCELNPSYVEMATRLLREDAPLFA